MLSHVGIPPVMSRPLAQSQSLVPCFVILRNPKSSASKSVHLSQF
ncbi:hypothetical protein ABIB27_003963 [Arthrobacter sp. UYEF21]